MTALELLAPARNAQIGIAAIDCGADAVYIAGPAFGARKDAGNPTEELIPLCEHAHRFGARIFVTFNISVRDDELPEMHAQMLSAQAAGADAFIIRDERVCSWKDITIPLHASTQCAIRTPERARYFESLGCTRLILERELSLEQIAQIRKAVSCELEFFVHGALCVCYSGDCRLSEYIDGRSADRGECIQACRSLYDLVDGNGKVLVRNKALLSLKDFSLLGRLNELAEAGICSFKVEGRLKSESYVKNVVRAYSIALDNIVASHPDLYRRASFGRVHGGFEPDLGKSFNRGYTELFLDGRRSRGWSSMDAPKWTGECIGKVTSIRPCGRGNVEIRLSGRAALQNGDGFTFIGRGGITGFRADICEESRIICRQIEGLKVGDMLYRNVSAAFEKELGKPCRREIEVNLSVSIHGKYDIDITAESEDGRRSFSPFKADVETAENRERAEALIREGLGKRVEEYSCRVVAFEASGSLPLLSSATINSIRRMVVSDLERSQSGTAATDQKSGAMASSGSAGTDQRSGAMASDGSAGTDQRSGVMASDGCASPRPEELMRSKYCIRYELGMCPVHQGAKPSGPLYLVNNGRRFGIEFDCKACEMVIRG